MACMLPRLHLSVCDAPGAVMGHACREDEPFGIKFDAIHREGSRGFPDQKNGS